MANTGDWRNWGCKINEKLICLEESKENCIG